MIEYQPAEHELVRAVRGTTTKLADGRSAALARMSDAPAARARARAARAAAVSCLPATLEAFTRAAEANGTQVHRAADADAAVRTALHLLERARARRVVKSKSMATEEIHLRDFLERHGREVVETDLGEWIVQLAGQMPSHIIVPAVHLPRQRIRTLLSEVAGRDLGLETPALAAFARAHLRQKFLEADAGISGANLLIAETGSLMIVSNEGNARMCTTLPRLHIAVVGVEKVVRTWDEALTVLSVLPRSATGQAITQYVSFLSGPRRAADAPGDGPDELHVILLDNGRSALVGTPAEELLYCIRCGACLNACPVYRTMGGHAYGSVYPGPIGAALTPRLSGGRQGRDLPWASSLCGACREACPVGIQLDDQLIALRAEYPKPAGERIAMRGFAAAAGEAARFRGALRVARVLLGGVRAERLPGPLDGWTRSRSLRALSRGGQTYPARVTGERRLAIPLGRGRPRGEASGLRPSGSDPAAAAGSPPSPVGGSAAAGPGAAPPDAAPGTAPGTPEVGAPPDAPESRAAAFAAQWRRQGGQAELLPRAALETTVRRLVGAGPVSADAILGAHVEGVPEASPLEAEVGLVWAEAGAAETGTLVLRSGDHSQRRRSLLPPRAIFVVDEGMVGADLPEAFAALDLLQASPRPAAVTLVSGPSRSSDIENDLVIGVHGPGDVWALVVLDPGGG